MKTLKSARTLAASLGVLAFGALAATPAMAFDKVDWDWYADVDQDVDIDAYIDLDIDTTGMVQVEKLQVFVGNVEATSEVSDIDVEHYCDFDELAEVISRATAIGNLQVITSDVPVYLHDAQFVFGGGENNDPCYDCDYELSSLNGGFFSLAEITATSDVSDIDNATVDSSATAIANLISVDLQSDVNGTGYYAGTCGGCDKDALSNHVLIADITQVAFADVKAESIVDDVDIDAGYNGSFDTPVVSSVATAIGNAVIINVSDVQP